MYAQTNLESNLQSILKEKIEKISNLISQKDFTQVIEQLNSFDAIILERYRDEGPIVLERYSDFLYRIFNPEFFKNHALDFVNVLKTYSTTLTTLLGKTWFYGFLTSPEGLNAFNLCKTDASKEFCEIVDTFSPLLTTRKASHLFGTFVTSCKYGSLEGSHRNIFEPIFEKYRDVFFSNLPKLISEFASSKTPRQQKRLHALFESKPLFIFNSISVSTSFPTKNNNPEVKKLKELENVLLKQHQFREESSLKIRELRLQLQEQMLRHKEQLLPLKEEILSQQEIIYALKLRKVESDAPVNFRIERDQLASERVEIQKNLLQVQEEHVKLKEERIQLEEHIKLKGNSLNPKKTDINHLTSELVSSLHFSAFSICRSKSLGDFIVVGNVGAGTDYRGIQIYKQRPNTETLVTQILELDHTIPHTEYLKLISGVKGELLFEIPVCEQLKGYCGLRSATELNEYSNLFFRVLHRLEKPVADFDEEALVKAYTTPELNALSRSICRMFHVPEPPQAQADFDEALEITNTLHTKFMNFVREQIGLQLINELRTLDGARKLGLSDQFFQDLYTQAKRYNVPNKLLIDLARYMHDHNIQNIVPQSCYENYLLNERYSRLPIPFGPAEKHHQTILNEQCNRLIALYHELHNDYDYTLLERLRFLDDRISDCVVYGFNRARAIAYNAQGPDPVDHRLQNSALGMSFQKLSQTPQRALVKFSR